MHNIHIHIFILGWISSSSFSSLYPPSCCLGTSRRVLGFFRGGSLPPKGVPKVLLGRGRSSDCHFWPPLRTPRRSTPLHAAGFMSTFFHIPFRKPQRSRFLKDVRSKITILRPPKWGLWPPDGVTQSPKNPLKIDPRPEKASKTPLRRSKTSNLSRPVISDGSNTSPRCSQDAPKHPQDSPRPAQNPPRQPPEAKQPQQVDFWRMSLAKSLFWALPSEAYDPWAKWKSAKIDQKFIPNPKKLRRPV